MTDFENKDLTGQGNQPVPEAPEAPKAPEAPQAEQAGEKAPDTAPYTGPDQASVTPHLTLDPEPAAPEIPTPEAPQTSAQAFHMPEAPHAPEPPKEQPAYQQAPPVYNQPPQYSAPQYGAQPPYQTPYQQQNPQPLYNVPPAGYLQKSRLAAGLLGILFGVFGVHNFYLGFNSRATVQLIVSLLGGLLTCGLATAAMMIWGFVEGVLILSANNPARMYDGNGVILKD